MTDKGFDSLVSPVIVCSRDGKVIYKNLTAKKRIPLPRTGRSICGRCEMEFPSGLDRGVLAGFDFDGKRMTALCFPYQDWIALIFSPFFCWKEGVPAFREAFGNEFVPDLCEVLDAAFDRGKGDFNTFRFSKAEERLESVISRALFSGLCPEEKFEYYALSSFEKLSEMCVSVLSKCGYRIDFEKHLDGMDPDNTVDLKLLLFIFSSLLILSLNLSDKKSCHIESFCYSGRIVNEFRFKCGRAEVSSVCSCGALAKLFPEYGFILKLTERVCDIAGCTFRANCGDGSGFSLIFDIGYERGNKFREDTLGPQTEKKAFGLIEQIMELIADMEEIKIKR